MPRAAAKKTQSTRTKKVTTKAKSPAKTKTKAAAKKPALRVIKGGKAQKTGKARPNGKDNKISSDLSEVVQDYMPLVRHAVNRITVGSAGAGILQYEDMLSYGVQGLIEAYNAFDPTSPFGGYKESGFGREGGRHGLLPYLKGVPT